MADIFFTVGIVCFALAVVSLIATAILFFRLNIRTVLAELSGKTATEAIAKIRQDGPVRKHKGRSLQSVLGDEDSGSLLSIEKSEKKAEAAPVSVSAKARVASLDVSESETTMLASGSESATTMLAEDTETQTTILSDAAEEATTMLSGAAEQQTTILSDLTTQNYNQDTDQEAKK